MVSRATTIIDAGILTLIVFASGSGDGRGAFIIFSMYFLYMTGSLEESIRTVISVARGQHSISHTLLIH